MVDLLDAQDGRLSLEPVGEVGSGRRGAEGEDQNYKQAYKEPRVAPDPGPEPPIFVGPARAGKLPRVSSVHAYKFTRAHGTRRRTISHRIA